MGREVRKVPATWEHPKKDGDYIPLHDGLCKALSTHYREKAMWEIGYRRDWSCTSENAFKEVEHEHIGLSFEEWTGGAPDPDDYMPDWAPEYRTHYQMYEDTSEGTPISPVMETPEDLAQWLADNNASAFGSSTATKEQWLATINAGWAPSAVMSGGVLQSGVEFATHESEA